MVIVKTKFSNINAWLHWLNSTDICQNNSITGLNHQFSQYL